MIWNILFTAMMGTMCLFFLYIFYMTVRNDLRDEKERKEKFKSETNSEQPYRRSK